MSDSRQVGEEARKSHAIRLENGFIATYLSGPNILDIGYKGYIEDVVPIVPQAIGVELDYPGYDGRTLPFAEGSQDAVFASHCLEHIPDFVQAFRDWHRVLRVGGYLVVMVPHQFLYEKRIDLPSRYNGDHQRLYTPASLMADVEMALPPNSYRLRHLADNDRHFDYAIPPDRHSGGCYEIELVVEKIAAPAWSLETAPWRVHPRPSAPDPGVANTEALALARRQGGGLPRVSTRPAAPWNLALYDFAPPSPGGRRILAMQLGHLGDFIIGLPALARLRSLFAGHHVTLVVGSWNHGAAETSGLADEIVLHDHFPQDARDWDGQPVQSEEAFSSSVAGVFDAAVDLRADEDTRHLLKLVDARIRCGIGAPGRFAFLDVALPPDHADRRTETADRMVDVLLGPERFHSRMPVQTAFAHSTDFRATDMHVIYGPYLHLPAGRFSAGFGLHWRGLPVGHAAVRVSLDVAQGGSEVLASRVVGVQDIGQAGERGIVLEFDNQDDGATIEFRVHVAGRPWRGTLGFTGVRLDRIGALGGPRLRRANLHVGEQLSLLVELMADRTLALYPAGQPPALPRPGTPARPVVAIAPASNSDLRDWPAEHYATLVGMLARELDCSIQLIGGRAQSGILGHIAQASGAGRHVANLAGQTAWADLPAILQAADLVICNNSGIAHLAASIGARTLAIYSASHQPQEWGPRGPRSKALMAVLPCSPCGHDRLADCPNDHACMRGLLPAQVFDVAAEWLAA